jgi:putative nucleotidyltransferase with HDIG domain
MTTLTVDNKVKQVISNIRNLPTPPIVFHQIQKVIKDPKVNASHIAAILAEDPAMSVKVLKLTNSAFYGLSREVESVKQAVVIVGLEAIKNLVLSASVLDMFKGKVDPEFQEKYWRHSLAVAFCSRLLANKCREKGIVDPDAAFSGGLLHDIGKVVIGCFMPDEFKKYAAARAEDKESMTHKVEERVLGYDHAQVGAGLAVHWKLPHKVVDAVTYHHYPEACAESDPIVHIVHVANYIAKKTFYEQDDAHLIGKVHPTSLEELGQSAEHLEHFGDLLREEYVKAETFMQLAGLH